VLALERGICESDVLGFLEYAGLRATRHRKVILRFLLESGRPVSHSEVKGVLPQLDRVTIYRTLAAFVNAGIAHQVQSPDGSWRFCAHRTDGKGCPGNHPHFFCTSCGAMICLTGHALERIDVPEGCEVSGKQFVIWGRCASCRRGDGAD
jgi:Fur family ferric uptake transcriptional regulator/Fur family zinc uptake transcriptional regulator